MHSGPTITVDADKCEVDYMLVMMTTETQTETMDEQVRVQAKGEAADTHTRTLYKLN